MAELDLKLWHEAGKVFSPGAPIDKKELFAGRLEQIRRLVETITQRGQHAIIFGERGVGKTSLANVLSDFVKEIADQELTPKVNCDGTDDYSSLWIKIFSEIPLISKQQKPGFKGETTTESKSLANELPTVISPDLVRKILTILSHDNRIIIIIDEFNRLIDDNIRNLFADTIKTLSDNSVNATLIIVGVADNVDELIEGHQSIERALIQIRMPRMSREELNQILLNGLSKLNMELDIEARDYITFLSQGLPHYTHLLGLYAAREAIQLKNNKVIISHVESAIKEAITNAQRSIQSTYHKATASSRKQTLYPQVLLACAMATPDELGFFAASDVREPVRKITGKTYDIPAFSRHLNDFCEAKRGPILSKMGYKHRFRFRFINPLMQPYIIMNGLSSGIINRSFLKSR